VVTYVPVSDVDSDGDGIPNILDTCPGAPNSGQDADHDGIDDTCDSMIGSPTNSGGAAGSGTAMLGGSGSASVGAVAKHSNLVSTTSSSSTSQDATKLASTSSRSEHSPARHRLKTIYWLRWAALLVICWLLLLLLNLGLNRYRAAQANQIYQNG
jgi:hypothetical protein